jgi:glutamine synthetase
MFSRPWSRRLAASSVGSPGFVADLGRWDARQAEAGLDQIDLVRLVFCDPHGLARSKTLTADSFRAALRNGMDFSPGPFLFDTGHAIAIDIGENPGLGVDELIGAGDFLVVPDPLTFQVMPEVEPRTAWVLGDEYLRDGTPHPLSTRHVLRRVCARYAAHGLEPVVGLEVEWYLTRLVGNTPGNRGNGFGLQGVAPAVEAVNAGYQFNLDAYFHSVADVANPLSGMLLALGLPLRTMEHESGPGQLEFTFSPMLASDAAYAMLLFRTVVKQACARRGFHASFMSLPKLDSFDPSGWHLHQSVAATVTGGNVFASEDADGGISAEGKAYIDGILARARDLCLLSVPTVNGYRRFGENYPLAPMQIGWSFEDRRAMVRVLGAGDSTHVENRVGEPCANPYLAMAAQLSAGLDGLLGERAAGGPGETLPEAAGDTLPLSLREALEVFRASKHVGELLGTPLTVGLVKLKESEVSRFEAWCESRGGHEPLPGTGVTDWEQREYFGVY